MKIFFRPLWLVILIFMNLATMNCQAILDFGEPPELTPKIFAHNVISLKDRLEFGSVFSADGKEFYFAIDKNGKSEILATIYNNKAWQAPETIISHPRFGFNDPFLSPDGNRLYYISDLTKGSYDESVDHDIWYSERQSAG